LCRGFESLLRYHLSPHSLDPIGVGSLAEERRQAPGDLDLDAARAGGVAGNSDSLDQVSHRLGGFRIARADAFG
jgi:hypothetical protein